MYSVTFCHSHLSVRLCIPVMAAVAVRKKVVSVGHSPPGVDLSHCNIFFIAALVLFDHLSVSLSVCLSGSQLSFYVFFKAALSSSCVLSLSCSLYFLSSPFCLYPV